MFLKKIWILFFLSFSGCFFYFAAAQNNADYKNWTLKELLFMINSGKLTPADKEVYLEYYLQKAKKEQSAEDIITAYQKKVYLLKDYTGKKQYADSLLSFALELKDNQAIGIAYNIERNVEYINKDYQKALDYGLKAEEYLEKTNDSYTLNKVKSSVGSMYYHLEDYAKSEKITKEALIYYKNHLKGTDNTYNNTRGYINNLYGLGKTYFRLQKNDTLSLLLNEGYEAINQLNTKDKILETAYFDLINGMYNHRMQYYTASDSLLNAALLPIQNNGDFANEHLAYLYLGKNAWDAGQRERALPYFEKIETLYQNQNFSNVELSEAFSYLIAYYQDKKEMKKELHYTKLLMRLSTELHKQNSRLSSYMHTHLDTKKLETSKKKLEHELTKSKLKIKELYGIVVILALVLFAGLLYYQKVQKKLKQQYKQLISQQQHGQEQTESLSQNNEEETKDNTGLQNVEMPETAEVLNTVQIIFKKLENFEKQKGFLQKITQDELARQLGTNRNTLSKFFNEEKKISFSDYLKHLRIQHAIRELTYNPKLHHLTLNGLADEFGFGSGKNFSASFKEIAKISVMDFIKMRRQDENFKELDKEQLSSS
jgi:AraC-like DNA-binding protein/tetratricopeptide (TPR) repeat protein